MSDPRTKTLSLCAFCYEELPDETLGHAAVCSKHPAVVRAERAEARVRELEKQLRYLGVNVGGWS